jgi:hypothetical protein
MDLRESRGSESRLAIYVEGLASVIGHGARVQPLRDSAALRVSQGRRMAGASSPVIIRAPNPPTNSRRSV